MLRTVAVVLLLCGCPEKKSAPKPAPAETEGTKTAPILQPVEKKLDNAMDKNENRATPDPE
jgi:hypothetical protein